MGQTVDAAGYVLRPGVKAELIVLVSARGAGEATWSALRVEYRFKHEHYVITLRNGFQICAPSTYQCV